MNPLTRLSKTPTTFCCGLRGTACSRRLARRRRRLWLLRLRGRSVLHRPSPPPASHTRLSSAFDTSTKLTGQMLPLSPLPANTCSKHAAPPEKARGNILALSSRDKATAQAEGQGLCFRCRALPAPHLSGINPPSTAPSALHTSETTFNGVGSGSGYPQRPTHTESNSSGTAPPHRHSRGTHRGREQPYGGAPAPRSLHYLSSSLELRAHLQTQHVDSARRAQARGDALDGLHGRRHD